MDLALDGVKCDGVVGCVGREDGDCVSRRESIDCGAVGERVGGVVGGEGGE